jgi:UDP-N-acetyl-D-mannosaminuronic acid dehydrogenase
MRLAAGNRGRVIAVEPNIAKPPKELERCGVALTDTVTAIDAANVIVLLVGHRQFRYIDRHALSGKRVIDTRGLWSAAS